MCTVSYIPLKNGYLLTSNRDENPERLTIPHHEAKLPNGNILTYPKDALKNGTWVASESNGRCACLLNGAFENHTKKPSYTKSRGNVVLEAFLTASFMEYGEEIELEEYEPFTLILIDENALYTLVWDGAERHFNMHPKNERKLWSSATLYNREQHKQKLAYFNAALDKSEIATESVLETHGLKNENPFILDRPKVKTVSITQVQKIDKRSTLTYYPL